MIEIQFNRAKNLLTVSHRGHVTVSEASDLVSRLEKLGAELPSGFRLLTDLSGLKRMDVECVPHIKTAMTLLNRHGVSSVVRIVPDPKKDIGLKIMSLFHYGKRVGFVTCETMAEAVKVLEAGSRS
jgi:hypothetical protein